jgi:D-alanyl-D-alanine carboxypeptidase (penicillin-binding protein 5/6)
MKGFIRLLSVLLAVMQFFSLSVFAEAPPPAGVGEDARSVILIEAESGAVLCERNADQPLPPASVTKVMSMLLVMEAVDSGKVALGDEVTVSAYAAKMGGSQVYLKEGERMSVHELLKCVVVSSANDACVALAEHIAGSEEAFVNMMNVRARELGMTHTVFENTNGLDDDTVNHVTSARDIALMSRELITKHGGILEYSSIWMDSIRDGAFGLTNTNRLIRFYSGANGLKTGSTSKARFCISASAKRDGMQLICVVMGAPTRDSRNETAKRLLDYGFANYAYESFSGGEMTEIKVTGAMQSSVPLCYGDFKTVVEKQNKGKITYSAELPESVSAPIKSGQVLGTVTYELNGVPLATVDITAGADAPRITYFQILSRLFEGLWR